MLETEPLVHIPGPQQAQAASAPPHPTPAPRRKERAKGSRSGGLVLKTRWDGLEPRTTSLCLCASDQLRKPEVRRPQSPSRREANLPTGAVMLLGSEALQPGPKHMACREARPCRLRNCSRSSHLPVPSVLRHRPPDPPLGKDCTSICSETFNDPDSSGFDPNQCFVAP